MSDVADRADAAVEQHHAEALARHRAARMARGEGFGTPVDAEAMTPRICEDCAEEIPPARIAALPWARRCVECAELAERRPT